MKNILKDYHALQDVRLRCTAAALCMVCTMFFAATGCGRQEASPVEEEESPYYYYANFTDGTTPGARNFQKVYLRLNTKYATLTLKEPHVPEDILRRGITASEFQCDYADNIQYKGKSGIRRYWTELSIEEDLSARQYLKLLADIKQKNKDVIVGPYFNSLDGTKIGGTGIFFHVKLKDEADEVLLEQMAKQTGSIIHFQVPFMTAWYAIMVTEDSELNLLECANIFYESELFDIVENHLWYHAEGTDFYLITD